MGIIHRIHMSMQIFVQTVTGKTFTLDVEPYDTIHALKAKTQEKEGIPCEQQRFLYVDPDIDAGKVDVDVDSDADEMSDGNTNDPIFCSLDCTLDDAQTLFDRSIKNESTLHLILLA